MNIIVVGGAGQVGRTLRPAFEQEHTVSIFDRVAPEHPPERCYVGDVNDEALIERALRGQEAMVWLAMGVDHSLPGDPVQGVDVAFDVNAKALYRWVRAAVAAGCRRIVYASTLSVYQYLGMSGYNDEMTPPDAIHPYGFTKRIGELICASAAEADMGVTAIALRLNAPRDGEAFEEVKYVMGQRRNFCALGPHDTQRLFLAALALGRYGYFAVQASGDLENKRYPNTEATRLLGWTPENR